MSTSGTTAFDDLLDRRAYELIMDGFPGSILVEGRIPMTATEAVTELLQSTRELVAYMREVDPAKLNRGGWKRIVSAVAAVEEALGEYGDLEEMLEDWTPPARVSDPTTSHEAASVASIGSGSSRFALARAFYENPAGLTADEAVDIAALGNLRNPWRRVYDLSGMGIIHATGTTRTTSAGAEGQVYVMAETARAEWAAKIGA